MGGIMQLKHMAEVKNEKANQILHYSFDLRAALDDYIQRRLHLPDAFPNAVWSQGNR